MLKKYKFIVALLFIALSTTGCIKVKSSNKPPQFDGGVYKTVNQGTTWKQKVLISTVSGAPGTFGGLNLSTMEIDPSDSSTFYFGSINNGLFYTYDGSETWGRAKTLGLRTISSIAIDARDHCNLYVGSGNRIFKSSDCSRSWEEMYYDNEKNAVMDALAVDHYDGKNVYAAISRGDLIKSIDGGKNWQTLERFGDRVEKLLIDPNDSRIVYVVTTNQGIYRSIDSGTNWSEMEALKEALTEHKLGIDIRDVLLVKNQPGTIFLATYYGLLKSIDSGETWENIQLILPSKKATINAIAVNPQNLNEIFYVTNTTFYRSNNGGQSWSTLKLPSSRAGLRLFVDPEQPNVMYLGIK